MKLDIAAIRARAEACFRGPWTATNFAVECGWCPGDADNCSRCAGEGETEVERIESPDEYPGGQIVCDVPGLESFSKQHATFIAAARTDVPALCARVEELESNLTHVQKSLGQCQQMRDSLAERSLRLEAALREVLENDCYHPENLPKGDERCRRARAALEGK